MNIDQSPANDPVFAPIHSHTGKSSSTIVHLGTYPLPTQALLHREVTLQSSRPKRLMPRIPTLNQIAEDLACDMDLLRMGESEKVRRHLAYYIAWLRNE